MYNNNFNNVGLNRQYYPNYQQPMNMGVQRYDLPLQEIRFLNADQIKGFIVYPNTSVMLIDRDNKLVYIESADNMGNLSKQVYSYNDFNEMSKEPKFEIKKEDFDNLATKDDVKRIVVEMVDKLQTKSGGEKWQSNNK